MPTRPSHTITLSIDCPATEAYDFAANPENLPKWAPAFCLSVARRDGEWFITSPIGEVRIRFAAHNPFGILDHYVSVGPGSESYIPMRIIPNGTGCEVIFTFFRDPDMTEEQFAGDIAMVGGDLEMLRRVLERRAA